MSPGHLTLFFLTLYCITDNIFYYLIDGLSGLSKMFADRDDGFTNNQIVRTVLCEINRSVFKCRFRLIPVIIKLEVPILDNFRWRTENRIEATAPYIQFIIAVVIVDLFQIKFVFHQFPPSCNVYNFHPNWLEEKQKSCHTEHQEISTRIPALF